MCFLKRGVFEQTFPASSLVKVWCSRSWRSSGCCWSCWSSGCCWSSRGAWCIGWLGGGGGHVDGSIGHVAKEPVADLGEARAQLLLRQHVHVREHACQLTSECDHTLVLLHLGCRDVDHVLLGQLPRRLHRHNRPLQRSHLLQDPRQLVVRHHPRLPHHPPRLPPLVPVAHCRAVPVPAACNHWCNHHHWCWRRALRACCAHCRVLLRCWRALFLGVFRRVTRETHVFPTARARLCWRCCRCNNRWRKLGWRCCCRSCLRCRCSWCWCFRSRGRTLVEHSCCRLTPP